MNKLDILKFIDSKAIRDYMKKDNSNFSTMDAASIVNVTNRNLLQYYLNTDSKVRKPLTIEDKHKVFKQILKDFPNELLQEGEKKYFANDKIKEYMANELSIIKDFKKNTKRMHKYVYTIKFMDSESIDENLVEDDELYDTLDACLNVIMRVSKNYPFASKRFLAIVSRVILDEEYIYYIDKAVLNEKFEFVDCMTDDEKYENYHSEFWMDNIHLMYKIPFSDGDLVINKNDNRDGVMVIYKSKKFGYDFLVSNGRWAKYLSSDYKLWSCLEYYGGNPNMSDEEIKKLKAKTRRLVTKTENELRRI